jgi:cytochrome c oxidase subunit 2
LTQLGRVYARVLELSIPDRLELISKSAQYLGVALLALLVALLVRALSVRTKPRTDFQVLRAISRACVATAVGSMGTVSLGLLWLSYVTYLDASVAPADAYDIQVLSEQGVLAFGYPNGKQSRDRLVVPAGKPVRLVLSSKDATRGVAIPQLKLRQTAMSGRYTTVWFQVPSAGTMRMLCTQGCSLKHSPEPIVEALGEAQFESWLASSEPIASSDSTRQGQHAGSR